MEIVELPLEQLHPWPTNARSHDERNIAAIRASLRTFGQVEPLVVQKSTMGIIGGNGRLESMKLEGWTKAKCYVLEIDDVKAQALGIALNRTAELAEWNPEVLNQNMKELVANDFDVSILAFDPKEMVDIVGEQVIEGATDPDTCGEPDPEHVTQEGDVWTLGNHLLACSDSAQHWPLVMRGDKADLMVTDPPYGVAYVGKTSDALTIENDATDEAGLEELVKAWFDAAEQACRPGAYWYATVPPGPLHLIFASDWKRRKILRQIMVWAKDSMVLGHSEFHYQHEPILFGWMPNGDRRKCKDRTKTTLWSIPRPKASREHPTMKPIALYERAITYGSNPGDIVYEPFSGSGTCLLACEVTGRRCRAIELAPKYVDVAIVRWQNFSRKTAVLSDGRTFAQVKAERVGS